MSFPSYILLDATFHQHRQAFWYVLMELTDPVDPADPCDDAVADVTEAYYEIYSDY